MKVSLPVDGSWQKREDWVLCWAVGDLAIEQEVVWKGARWSSQEPVDELLLYKSRVAKENTSLTDTAAWEINFYIFIKITVVEE